jgi:hypothetical protein
VDDDGCVSDGNERSDDSDCDDRPRDHSLTRTILTIEDIIQGKIPPPPNTPPPDFQDKSLQNNCEEADRACSFIDLPLIVRARPEGKKSALATKLSMSLKDVELESRMLAWSKAKLAGGFKDAHFELREGVLV